MSKTRPVVVMELPEHLKLGEVQTFLREIKPLLTADRPRLVFDFSQVNQIDSAGVDMLLHCLEEVMKRDGDLKLAAVAPESAVILELTRVDRLFEVFDSVAGAVESFQGYLVRGMQAPCQWSSATRSGMGNLKMAG